MQENTLLYQKILSKLPQDLFDIPLHVFDSVTSTNDLLRAAAEQGAPEFTVYAAAQQTAGKGRQGRSFYSPPMTGLYLSILFRPQLTAERVLMLTPMAAVAASDAIEQVTGIHVSIKWVNDLLLHGRKICGILTESSFSDGAVPDYAIVGIGINLLPPPDGFPAELRGIAGAVYPVHADAQEAFTSVAAALISALIREYHGLPEKRFLASYRARLCMLNRTVTVCENGTERPAAAIAVDDDLRLLVRYEDGTEQWRSTGEIRIRV